MDIKDADDELMNWGRSVWDGWLHDHILYTVPPTSEGYIAPVVAYDDPEPARHPIDEQMAEMTERIVVAIGTESGGFDSFRVLQHWYTRLMMLRREGEHLSRQECLKRLSKHMQTSFHGADRMLKDAQARYCKKRLQRFVASSRIVGGNVCPQNSPQTA